MNLIRHAVLIVKKDLLLEFRNKSLLLSTIVFTLLISVVIQIAFNADLSSMRQIAPGIFWIPILLTGMMSFNKYGQYERGNRSDIGLLLTPVDRASIFTGKLIGNYLMVCIVTIVTTLSFFLFLKLPLPESIFLFLFTVFFGSFGFTSAGVFLALLVETTTIKELVLPLLLFPVCVPLILSIVQLTEVALFSSPVPGLHLWVSLLLGYNIIFSVVPILLIDVLMEV